MSSAEPSRAPPPGAQRRLRRAWKQQAEGAGLLRRWWLTAAAYLAGSALGGATSAPCFGALGMLLPRSPKAALGALAVAALLGLLGRAQGRRATGAHQPPPGQRAVARRISRLGLRRRLRVPARPRRGHDRHQRRDVPHVRRRVPRATRSSAAWPSAPRSACSVAAACCSPRPSAIRPPCASCSVATSDGQSRLAGSRSAGRLRARSRQFFAMMVIS